MTTVYYLHKTKNKKIEIKSLTAPEAIFNNASQRMKIEKKKKRAHSTTLFSGSISYKEA